MGFEMGDCVGLSAGLPAKSLRAPPQLMSNIADGPALAGADVDGLPVEAEDVRAPPVLLTLEVGAEPTFDVGVAAVELGVPGVLGRDAVVASDDWVGPDGVEVPAVVLGSVVEAVPDVDEEPDAEGAA